MRQKQVYLLLAIGLALCLLAVPAQVALAEDDGGDDDDDDVPPSIDADTLDGLDSTQFLRSDASDSFTSGTLTLDPGTTLDVDGALTLPTTGISGAGSGSGLDADRLDGTDSSAFLTSVPDHGFGTQNTRVGQGALTSNTTGYRNTASGYQALYYNTYGSYNTANGTLALRNNTSGSYNTANGYGALRSNTTGYRNTASGLAALFSNTTGYLNTASGFGALVLNTTGALNTASGSGALRYNTTGFQNTASGDRALRNNTTGYDNTASGAYALRSNTTGTFNTASGIRALYANTTGQYNTAVGVAAGFYATTGNRNIFLGSGAYGVAGEGNTIRIGGPGFQNRTFIAGISGVTVANDAPVLIDSNTGQLGTVSSSRRFKKQIEDMAEASEKLLDLRPVTFRYKQEPVEGTQPLQFGLIAEEVAEVLPDLVVYDEEGQPETVRYHLLSSMLLNELKKQHRQLADQRQSLVLQEDELARLRGRLARLEALEAKRHPPREDHIGAP